MVEDSRLRVYRFRVPRRTFPRSEFLYASRWPGSAVLRRKVTLPAGSY